MSASTPVPPPRTPAGVPAGVVLDLAEVEADMLAFAGGKAVNLGVLLRAGFPVPAGFAITTPAYQRVAEQAGLDALLDRIDDPAVLAAEARKALLAVDVPEQVRDAIRALVRGPVAVRSSATAEDLPHASFAGQQDTYLNVDGPEAVAEAVRRCWASLWTDRAVAYRGAVGIDHRGVRLAVVVQEMVDAAVAGVMFTADPVTGRRGHAVIEAAPGLGEAVVSGAVNPDHIVVDTAARRILEHRTGQRRHGGGEPCLTDEQVRALADLGARVEAYYGAPQDTEWAIDAGGAPWLTQARPITTLHPVPNGPQGLRVYFCATVAQGLYRPVTPMGIAAFRVAASSLAETVFGLPVADRLAGPPALTEAGGRVFLDITPVLRSRPGRTLVPRVLDFMEARSATVLRSLFDEPRLSVTRRSWLPFARRILRMALRYRIPVRLLRYLLRPAAAPRDLARRLYDLEARLTPPPNLTPAQRLDRAVRLLSTEIFPHFPAVVPAPGAGFAMLALAARLLGERASTAELQTVLRGLPHNVTTEMDLALWDVAQAVKADPAAVGLLLTTPAAQLAARYRTADLPPTLQRELARFLAAHGRRAVAEIDLGLPRWSEDPEHILGVLANYLRLEDPALPPDRLFARSAAEAERMVDVLAARAGGVRGRLVRFALHRARALAGLRETPKYLLVTTLAAAREQLAAVGAELAARGLLERPDDVFFVTLVEARAGLGGADVRALAARRREEYRRELGRRRVPRVLLSDGTDPEAVAGPAASAGGDLTGAPASPGVATGTARVVLDPVGARLEPGEVLVCPSTDPGWTPLFLTAGALVMEMGGANSHGAVVAREYGIPAVVGVAHATERVPDGAGITVDGTCGAVTISPGG